MLITPEIIGLSIVDTLLLLFATVAFVVSISIVKNYDRDATTGLQYSLEKQSYLVSVIIKYMLAVKVVLFLFYIFTLDKISFAIPGAMCAAGVVNADPLTTPLLFLKIINLYLSLFWIVLDREDMKDEKEPYHTLKFRFFLLLYLLIVIEIFIELYTLLGIDVNSVVDCCGAIFSDKSGSYIALFLNMPSSLIVTLFYGLYALLLFAKVIQNRYLFSFLNLLFLIIAIVSLIAFFGTYIYELPSHHCPFCLLQQDYNFIGYFLYIALFLGTFNGLVVGFVAFKQEELQQRYVKSLVYNLLYLLVVSYFPLLYYLQNGVWL
jgi:hypothetical protein